VSVTISPLAITPHYSYYLHIVAELLICPNGRRPHGR
jgi:hypothetical protein